jgi:hypothetical protein
MSYQLYVYREDHENFEAAGESQGIYSTGSTLDTLEGLSGFYDLMEIINVVEEVYGYTMVWGIVEDGQFVQLRDLATYHDTRESNISALSELVCAYLRVQDKLATDKFNTEALAELEKGECPECGDTAISTVSVHLNDTPEVEQYCLACKKSWVVGYTATVVTLK